jgi:hypothetical protein
LVNAQVRTDDMYDWLVSRWPDVALAVVLAIIFAIIADLVRVGSLVKNIFGRLKNRFSKVSIIMLRRRIAELERQRNTLASYASSDKALYMSAFRTLLSVLLFICLAGIMLIYATDPPLFLAPIKWPRSVFEAARQYHEGASRIFKFSALFSLGWAMGLASEQLRIAGWDSRAKIKAQLGIYERQIAELKAELATMAQKTRRRSSSE